MELPQVPSHDRRSSIQFVYSDEEFAEIRSEDEELQRQNHVQTLASIPPEEQTEEMRHFIYKPLPFFELFEEAQI